MSAKSDTITDVSAVPGDSSVVELLVTAPWNVAPSDLGAIERYTLEAPPVIDLKNDVTFAFSFGLDLSPGLTPEDSFFVSDGAAGKLAAISTVIDEGAPGNPLDLHLRVGFLGEVTADARINYVVNSSFDLLNPDGDPLGRTTLAELTGTDVAALFAVKSSGTLANSSLSARRSSAPGAPRARC